MARSLIFWMSAALVCWTLLLQQTSAHDHEDKCSCLRQNMLESDISNLIATNKEQKKYIQRYCPASTTAASTTTTTTEMPAACPVGYKKLSDFDNFCYKVITQRMNWTDGQARCRRDNRHAHLAYIDNADQNSDVVDYLLSFNDNAACKVPETGYGSYSTCGQRQKNTDCKTKFVWKVNSTAAFDLSFTYWRSTEPNCGSTLPSRQPEACLQYRCETDLNDNQDCFWNDYVCASEVCPLCQLEI